MNNQQLALYREIIKREERARNQFRFKQEQLQSHAQNSNIIIVNKARATSASNPNSLFNLSPTQQPILIARETQNFSHNNPQILELNQQKPRYLGKAFLDEFMRRRKGSQVEEVKESNNFPLTNESETEDDSETPQTNEYALVEIDQNAPANDASSIASSVVTQQYSYRPQTTVVNQSSAAQQVQTSLGSQIKDLDEQRKLLATLQQRLARNMFKTVYQTSIGNQEDKLKIDLKPKVIVTPEISKLVTPVNKIGRVEQPNAFVKKQSDTLSVTSITTRGGDLPIGVGIQSEDRQKTAKNGTAIKQEVSKSRPKSAENLPKKQQSVVYKEPAGNYLKQQAERTVILAQNRQGNHKNVSDWLLYPGGIQHFAATKSIQSLTTATPTPSKKSKIVNENVLSGNPYKSHLNVGISSNVNSAQNSSRGIGKSPTNEKQVSFRNQIQSCDRLSTGSRVQSKSGSQPVNNEKPSNKKKKVRIFKIKLSTGSLNK